MITNMKDLHLITEKALNTNKNITPFNDSLDITSGKVKKNILKNYKNKKNEYLISDNSDYNPGKAGGQINNTTINNQIMNDNKIEININNKDKSQIINIININGNYSMDQTKKRIINNLSNCLYDQSSQYARRTVFKSKQNRTKLNITQKYEYTKKIIEDINNKNNFVKQYFNKIKENSKNKSRIAM